MRACVEHAFGLLKNRFPVLAFPVHASLQSRADTVWCCVLLHNLFIDCGESAVELGVAEFADSAAATAVVNDWVGLAADVAENFDEILFESRGRPSALDRFRYQQASETRDSWYTTVLQLHGKI